MRTRLASVSRGVFGYAGAAIRLSDVAPGEPGACATISSAIAYAHRQGRQQNEQSKIQRARNEAVQSEALQRKPERLRAASLSLSRLPERAGKSTVHARAKFTFRAKATSLRPRSAFRSVPCRPSARGQLRPPVERPRPVCGRSEKVPELSRLNTRSVSAANRRSETVRPCNRTGRRRRSSTPTRETAASARRRC